MDVYCILCGHKMVPVSEYLFQCVDGRCGNTYHVTDGWGHI